MSNAARVSELVVRCGRGDAVVAAELLPLVYEELRQLAARYLRRERTDHTLQPTALVHEAYLRLVQAESIDARSRAQFIALAAAQIRKILVDYARRHRADKRGGTRQRVVLDEGKIAPPTTRNGHLETLDAALSALATRSQRQAQVVELRFFGGMTLDEVAGFLGVSRSTVKNDWVVARAWLAQHMAQ